MDKRFRVCNGSANPMGFCDSCFQPMEGTSIQCIRLIEVHEEAKVPSEAEVILKKHLVAKLEAGKDSDQDRLEAILSAMKENTEMEFNNFYKELQERLSYLVTLDTPDTQTRIAELELAIVRIQQILLEKL